MAVHGVHRIKPTFQRQRFDQLLCGGDFIAFLIHFEMPENKRIIGAESAQDVCGFLMPIRLAQAGAA